MAYRKRKLGYNMMLHDLGFDIKGSMPAIDIRKAIEKVEKIFDLVLIAEKMDESLILLKDLLNWEYSDIIFFTKNARSKTHVQQLSNDSIVSLMDLNNADMMLYTHFLNKHSQAVLRYGERKMADSVSILRSLRDQYFEDCDVKVITKENNTQFHECSGLVYSYTVDGNSNENCVYLSTAELPLLDIVRSKQKARLKS